MALHRLWTPVLPLVASAETSERIRACASGDRPARCPVTQARAHLILTVVWCVLVVPTVVWWHDSIAWVAFMSIYAIIASHWACWEAARAKEAIEEQR